MYKVITDTSTDGIITTIETLTHQTIESILDTKEQLTAYTLMELGWTPPKFNLEYFERYFSFLLFKYLKHVECIYTNWVHHKKLYEKLNKEKAENLLELANKVSYHHPERVLQIRQIIDSKTK